MKAINWTNEETLAVLGAMRTVATVNGTRSLDSAGLEMLRATADHVLHLTTDIDRVESRTPAEVADVVRGKDARSRALQFLVLVSYLPIETDADQVEIVDEFAAAFDVSTNMLTDLHMVRDKRLKRLVFDYSRRTLPGFFPGQSTAERIKRIAGAVHQYMGDPKVAARYQALEHYDEGTLGRAFFVFYRERGFPLPGEKGGFTDLLVSHDLTHILGGYNTDMTGEINVAGFEAGMSGTEFGWELLMEVILDFHLGLKFTTVAGIEEGRGHFHPEPVLHGYERGMACSVDLITQWDYGSVMDQPVEAIRQRYNITGVEGHHIPPPTELDAHPDKRGPAT